MLRRTFLTAGGVALAGCSSSSTPSTPAATPEPTPEPTPTTAPTPTETESVDYAAVFEQALVESEAEIDVDYLSVDGNVVFLEYVTDETTEPGLAEEIGTVAGAFAAAVGEGWGVEVVEVTVLDGELFPIGFYRIRGEWARQYERGELSTGEYSALVLETLEANE